MKKSLFLLILFFSFFCFVNQVKAMDLKCTYDLGVGQKYVVKYDCNDLVQSCDGDLRCNIIKSSAVERNFQKSDGTYQCPSKIYYKVNFGDYASTVNEYSVSFTKSSSFPEEAILMQDESYVGGENTCDEGGGYDYVCEWDLIYLVFNEGDEYAQIKPKTNEFKFQDTVKLKTLNMCPANVYTTCAEGVCSVSLDRVSNIEGEHPIDKDNEDIPNADDLEDQNNPPDEEEVVLPPPDTDIDISGFCNEPRVARTLQFLGTILFILKIFVPVIIIIMGSIDFAKAFLEGKSDELPKKIPVFVKRIIIGVLIFFIPSIIDFLFGVIDTYSETMSRFSNCSTCLLNPNDCQVDD